VAVNILSAKKRSRPILKDVQHALFGCLDDWVRHIARVEDWYVDFTARQFDLKADCPVIANDLSPFLREWGRAVEPLRVSSPSA